MSLISHDLLYRLVMVQIGVLFQLPAMKFLIELTSSKTQIVPLKLVSLLSKFTTKKLKI